MIPSNVLFDETREMEQRINGMGGDGFGHVLAELARSQQMMVGAMVHLAQVMMAPKRVIRDASGKIVGVETMEG